MNPQADEQFAREIFPDLELDCFDEADDSLDIPILTDVCEPRETPPVALP
jgi:hypothetical protein